MIKPCIGEKKMDELSFFPFDEDHDEVNEDDVQAFHQQKEN